MDRGRDGRRSRKPGARACRCGQSNGSWASTGPPSGVIWRPEVLQDGSSGWRPIRRHRIPWQRNGVTFSLNTYPDIFPDLRHANWPAEMSHSPHGECDIDAKRTDESPGFEQPASGADCIGSSGRVDGCQHTPRPPHHDRPTGRKEQQPWHTTTVAADRSTPYLRR